MSISAKELRCLLVPLPGDENMLLPAAASAEVIGYTKPTPIKGAPDWVLGTFLWRQGPTPLVRLETGSDASRAEVQRGARVVVLPALWSAPSLSFYGMLAAGVPRTLVLGDKLERIAEEKEDPTPPVLAHVVAGRVSAFIPDLERVETALARCLRGGEAEHGNGSVTVLTGPG